jgi:hypothetical protein
MCQDHVMGVEVQPPEELKALFTCFGRPRAWRHIVVTHPGLQATKTCHSHRPFATPHHSIGVGQCLDGLAVMATVDWPIRPSQAVEANSARVEPLCRLMLNLERNSDQTLETMHR